MASRLVRASYHGRLHRSAFDDVQAYCLFIGYPRSGHSLLGALLDAHPSIVIAHELDVLRYIQAGHVTRDRLFWLIVERDEGSRATRRTKRYDYSVPGQWQGRYDVLRAIGDKMGGESSLRLARRPELLDDLASVVRTQMRILHVVRNPFDNITTMHVRGLGTLRSCADRYFGMCETNDAIRRRGDVPIMDVRHEDMIKAPDDSLIAACSFLGLDAPHDYVRDCAAIVNPAPHRSRYKVPWPEDLVDEVQCRTDTFEFLSGYTFDT